jgi:legumain
VIVAGSKTFQNYRHQADACHAFQIVKKGGVPASQIILLMEDDVANAHENPFPGKLFNKPTAKGTPGVDVYDGCTPDYRGSVVTAKLFLDVLQGNSEAVNGLGSGKVLKSGPNDKVFINFADHGGAQIVEMPNGPYLHAKDLNAAIVNMHTKNMYQKLVFYMEVRA